MDSRGPGWAGATLPWNAAGHSTAQSTVDDSRVRCWCQKQDPLQLRYSTALRGPADRDLRTLLSVFAPACHAVAWPLLCCIPSAYFLRLPLVLTRGRWSSAGAMRLCLASVALRCVCVVLSPGRAPGAGGMRVSKLPASQQLVGTVTPAFDRPRTPALPLQIVCHLLGSGNQLHPTGLHQSALPLTHRTHTAEWTRYSERLCWLSSLLVPVAVCHAVGVPDYRAQREAFLLRACESVLARSDTRVPSSLLQQELIN